MDEMNNDNKFELTWWQWIFYIIGWLNALNIFFWVIMIILHFIFDKGNDFFGNGFHRRVWKFGVFTCLLALALIIFAILILPEITSMIVDRQMLEYTVQNNLSRY